jgi:pseudaminic acid cytidylyltransferase
VKTLAVIPARGGSKRIPDKNIVDFCGKPIIAYSLEAARDSAVFDEIHVSTDDQRIVETVERLGYPVQFFRPDELSDDTTPILPVLRWVLEEYERRGVTFEIVGCLFACAPLVTSQVLAESYRQYIGSGAGVPMLSVSAYPAPVEWAYTIDDQDVLEERSPGAFAIRSQDIQPTYYDTGTFSYFPSELVKNPEYMGGGTMIGYKLPSYMSVDIDNLEELTTAEILYLGRQQYLRQTQNKGT